MTQTKTLRHLTDNELATAGFTAGDIKQVRKYVVKGAETAPQRRLLLRYQQLRRDMVAVEEQTAAKLAKLADRYEHTHYTPDQLDTIPCPEARERALKLAAIWDVVEPTVAFPGVVSGVDLHDEDKKTNWYLRCESLPADLPPMFATAGRLTQVREKVYHIPTPADQYRYCTISLRSALSRAMNGKNIFAWGEVR